MAPAAHRGFRPTRRDLYVACFSAACTLLWAQFMATDNLSALLAHTHDDRHWEVKDAMEFPLINPETLLPPSPPKAPTPPHSPPSAAAKKPQAPFQIMPSTEVVAHGDGWTIFDNLYMFNGTLLVVSDEDASSFPQPRMITSTGKCHYFIPLKLPFTQHNYRSCRRKRARESGRCGVFSLHVTINPLILT